MNTTLSILDKIQQLISCENLRSLIHDLSVDLCLLMNKGITLIQTGNYMVGVAGVFSAFVGIFASNRFTKEVKYTNQRRATSTSAMLIVSMVKLSFNSHLHR